MNSASAALVNDRCFATALKTWSLRSDTWATAHKVAALHCGTVLIIPGRTVRSFVPCRDEPMAYRRINELNWRICEVRGTVEHPLRT